MSQHDGGCDRCRNPYSSFRVREGHSWPYVCVGCIEPGDEVWIELPNGQLVGDVAPEVST